MAKTHDLSGLKYDLLGLNTWSTDLPIIQKGFFLRKEAFLKIVNQAYPPPPRKKKPAEK